MTYVVTWSFVAVTEVGRLTGLADDPDAVRKAAEWVDYTLRRIPMNVGESRTGNDRVWYGDVLGAWYRVDQDAMTVKVLAIGPARRPR